MENIETNFILDRTSIRKEPVSSNQLQYWLTEKLHPGTSAYNIPSVINFKGKLDVAALETAIKTVIKRHEILRTVFGETGGHPHQEICRLSKFILEQADCSGKPREFVLSSINKEINRTFDLEAGPLARFKLFKVNEAEYCLCVTMHHIITDLRTKEIFSNEISELYNSISNNKEAVILPEAIQYSEYSGRQTEFRNSEKYRKMISTWKEMLSNTEGFLNFPTDLNPPSILSLRGREILFEIPENTADDLKKFSSNESVDPFVVLLSVYSLLLMRYSDQQDFNIGVPFTNRREDYSKDIAGCFMNILPIPVKIPDACSFRELMGIIRKKMLFAHRNQEVPFDRIITELKVKNNPAYNPIFQYGFTFEPPMNLNLNGIESSVYIADQEGSRLRFFMTLWTDSGRYRARLNYNSDLFAEETAERFTANYVKLLSSAISSPEAAITDLDCISGIDLAAQIEWNATECPYSGQRLIHDFLYETSRRIPDSTAVRFGHDSLTYSALNRLSNQAANYLLSGGIEPGARIGICMERSPEMIICIFAILKSGCVYVPLDPDYPEDRLEFMITDAGIKHLFTLEKFKEKLEALGPELILADKSPYAGQPFDNPHARINSEEVAYIIYTSGSTGKPKGVMIEHHSAVNRIEWMQKKYPVSEKDVILQKTPVTFDVSIWELFWWSFTGAAVTFLGPGMEKFPEEIVNEIDRSSITTMHFVPSMLNAFLSYVRESDCSSRLKSLRRVFASGEALPLNTVNLFNSLLHDSNSTLLINLYGPTEATVDVSYFDCSADDISNRVPIGKPIDNISLHIIDKNKSLLPVGAMGELVISGAGLARGYINRPELNSEKFIELNIGGDTKRIYRTGDKARYAPDGNIEYFGRIDNQVKIRGFRIELEEIENLILANTGVDQAVVIVKTISEEDKRLFAFITLRGNTKTVKEDIIQEIKDYLAAKLPKYMIPSGFIIPDTLPLSANGKADRKSLQNYNIEIKDDERNISLPENETEKIVLDCWKKIIKTGNIGIDDNFFDAGGDSLLALGLQNDLSKVLGIKIDIVKIFEYPTVRQFVLNLGNDRLNNQQNESNTRAEKRIEAIRNRRKHH
ncbi:MAG: amino acid adenylation domain-containing protein [Spirochaetes bacterium]|nr:amino acid adenylation domain-containing protein [Spirochaetota bacterium]